jgi:UDPglucose 6-dehydrogenase
VNDLRGSPALKICEFLNEQGCETAIFDPHANAPGICANLDDALSGADALVLVVDHDRFRSITPGRAKRLMRTPVVIDCRNYFDPARWKAAGFTVYTLGKRSAAPQNATMALLANAR